MVDEREIADLLADRPDLADGLAAVLAVDEETDEWEFDDVPVDSGVFGEIVGRGIVEDAGEGYQVADREAVRNAIASHERSDGRDADDAAGEESRSETAPTGGENDAETAHGAEMTRGDEGGERWSPTIPTGTGLRGPVVALIVGILFVVARALPYGGVFRDGTVVFVANDPYFYAYWVEGLLARSSSPFALGTLADISAPLNSGGGEPLFVATMWLVSTLLGGSPDVAAVVMAWYPVVAALCSGALVYGIGAYVLEDRRIGVGAAVLIALLPANALRTVVGFADHHAFDYVWVLATALTLAWLVARDDPSRRAVRRAAVALGVSVAGLTLAWEGAPLVLVPVAVVLAVSVPLDVAEGRSPWQTTRPVAAGLGLGAVLSLGVHFLLGWQSVVVVVVPTLLAGGTVALAAAGELVDRRGLSAQRFAAAELAVPIVGLVVVSTLVSGVLGQFLGGVSFLLGTGGISETGSAFAPDELLGVELFGLAHFVALPVMVWGVVRTLADDRRWLVVCVYGWYFFALSLVQSRFAGQFAPFVALFAATGVVWWAARYDLTSLPALLRSDSASDDEQSASTPDDARPGGAWFDTDALTARSGLAVGLVVVVLVAASGAYLPGKVTGGVVSHENYETATWMAEYADERGWSDSDKYVFSRWGNNRMFNYFVSGWAENYSYAQSNYTRFVSSDRPEAWYERLRNRTGFVVLEPLPRQENPMQERLYVTYGSRWQGYEAVSHYRAVYTSANRDNKVFVLVPGARVTGQAPPNATVEVRTDVDIPNDSFRYRQRVRTWQNGTYEVVVPYPGEYEVRRGVENENETAAGTVTVPESSVRNGTSVRVGS